VHHHPVVVVDAGQGTPLLHRPAGALVRAQVVRVKPLDGVRSHEGGDARLGGPHFSAVDQNFQRLRRIETGDLAPLVVPRVVVPRQQDRRPQKKVPVHADHAPAHRGVLFELDQRHVVEVEVLVEIVPATLIVLRVLYRFHGPQAHLVHLHGVEGEVDPHVNNFQNLLTVRTVDCLRVDAPCRRQHDVDGQQHSLANVLLLILYSVQVLPVVNVKMVGLGSQLLGVRYDDVRQPPLPFPLSPRLLVGVVVCSAYHHPVHFFNVGGYPFEGEDAVVVAVADTHSHEQGQVVQVKVRGVLLGAREQAADVLIVPEQVEEPV